MLLRIEKIELPEFEPIIGSVKQFFYRNKMEFSFSNSLGFVFHSTVLYVLDANTDGKLFDGNHLWKNHCRLCFLGLAILNYELIKQKQ